MSLTPLERIERVKARGFEEAARAVCLENGIEFPESLPSRRLLRCWLPEHNDRTGSLSVQTNFWKCFGCNRKGDAIDLLVELEGLGVMEAVARLERMLGIADGPEGLLAEARRERPTTVKEEGAWRRAIEGAHDPPSIATEVLVALRPYMRSPDPIVFGIAEPAEEWIFEELREEASGAPPRLARARRERFRALRTWALGVVRWIEREVERATGRDRLDLMLALGLLPTERSVIADELARILSPRRRVRHR